MIFKFTFFYSFLEFQRPVPKKCSPSIPKLSETKSKTKESTQVSSKPETTKKRNFEELFDSSDSSKKLVY